ncbi:MAG: transcriptional repressor [Acidobacteriia bacterium]|nr:transcriptional repressor [Terriglobia bacterium]
MLQFLWSREGHPTADEIFLAINRSDPRSSRATIYNNLHALAEAGVVLAVSLDAGPVRYEANRQRHHHFVCERCGVLEDIASGDVSYRPRRLHLGSRIVRDYQIVFRGVCGRCSKRQSRRC